MSIFDPVKDYIKRHPAISGAIAGGIAGTALFPGVGTMTGIAIGVGAGNTIGSDERARQAAEAAAAAPKSLPPEAGRTMGLLSTMGDMKMDDVVTVPVKPAIESKINWTQLASIVAMVAAYFGLHVSPETLVTIILGIAAAGDLLTMIWKTYFTTTITPSSAAKV